MNSVKIYITPFTIDITPPVGHPIAFGINEKVDSNIYIRGIVLDDNNKRIVIAAADVIYFLFSAHNVMVKNIADAAGTNIENIFLTSLHQHDSVRMVFPEDLPPKMRNIRESITPEYWDKCIADIHTEISKAIEPQNWIEVSRTATATRKISGLASNRRIYGDDGKIAAMRFSMCNNPELKEKPEGVYDPNLRTIAFLDKDDSLISALHFYATHPMAAYGREMVSADVPGVALEYANKELQTNDKHIYLTGCGGNVTFGKYTEVDNKEKSLESLGKRLGEELVNNIKALKTCENGKISIISESLELPLQDGIDIKTLKKNLEEADNNKDIFKNGRWLSVLKNWEKYGKRNVRLLSIGDIHMLELFSEMAVEYQLYANSLLPDKFLACTAYNESSPAYICTAKMYEEGGYEPTTNYLSPEIEDRLKSVISKLLTSIDKGGKK
jgi:hypothetical protein